MRRVWIIPKGVNITEQVIHEAISNNCPEIALGIPPILEAELEGKKLPLAYEEPAYPISEKPRDLAAEIDDLKTEVEALKTAKEAISDREK